MLLHFTRSKFDNISDWGMKSINGSWGGMIRKLMEDEADIALSDLYVSVERLEMLDFLFALRTTL
jgi:hypothetical protein